MGLSQSAPATTPTTVTSEFEKKLEKTLATISKTETTIRTLSDDKTSEQKEIEKFEEALKLVSFWWAHSKHCVQENPRIRGLVVLGMSIRNVPDFTDDICSFIYPSDQETNKQRIEFNEQLSRRRDQSIERIQEDVRKYEKIFFGVFYHLTRISFEYKKLKDVIMKEAKDFKRLPPDVLKSFLNTVHCSMTLRENALKPKQTVEDVSKEDVPSENETTGGESTEREIDEPFEMVPAAAALENDNSETVQEGSTTELEEEEEEFEKLMAVEDEDFKQMMEEYARKEEELDKANKRLKMDMTEEKEQYDLKEDIEARERERILKELEEEHREEKKRAQLLFEENLKEMRRRREEFEKETERIRLEDIQEMHKLISAYWQCAQLKLDWEMKEEELANWLRVIRQSVSRTKNQFSSFTNSISLRADSDPKGDDINKEQLSNLHYQTRCTYDFLRDACLKIKNIHVEVPDRKFLWILMKHISKVCHVVLPILRMIDDAESNPVNEELVQNLRTLFSEFDSSDVLYTFQLRSMEKTFDLQVEEEIEDPEEYQSKSSEVIEECVEPVEKGTDAIECAEQTSKIGEDTEKTNIAENKIGNPEEYEPKSNICEVVKSEDKEADEIKRASEKYEQKSRFFIDEVVDSENTKPDEIESDKNLANPTSEMNEKEEEKTNTENNH